MNNTAIFNVSPSNPDAKAFTIGVAKTNAKTIINEQIIISVFIKLLVNLYAFSCPSSFSILLNIGIYPALIPAPIKEKITIGIVIEIKNASLILLAP